MNYACAFLGLILLCAAIFWYAGGRTYYAGPVVEAQVEDSDSQANVDVTHELGADSKDEKSAAYQ